MIATCSGVGSKYERSLAVRPSLAGRVERRVYKLMEGLRLAQADRISISLYTNAGVIVSMHVSRVKTSGGMNTSSNVPSSPT